MKKIILLLLCIMLGPLGWSQENPPGDSPKVQVQSSVSTPKSTSVDKKNISVFPNPADNGIINITLTGFKGTPTELRILNVIGNEVHREVLNEMNDRFTRSIDLTNQNSGVYYVKLQADNFSNIKKVIVK